MTSQSDTLETPPCAGAVQQQDYDWPSSEKLPSFSTPRSAFASEAEFAEIPRLDLNVRLPELSHALRPHESH